MSAARVEAGLMRAGAQLQRYALVRARASVADAAGELPGVVAVIEPDGVALTGRGLRARAFGTRSLAADPRIAGIADAARRVR